MQRIKIVILGVMSALLVSYIISAIYTRCRYPAELTEEQPGSKCVCIYEGGRYDLVDVEEYIQPVLLGMMRDEWSGEMLKTMAIILRTGVYYQMENQGVSEDRDRNFISENQLREVRCSEQELKQRLGSLYSSEERRVHEAVASTRGMVIRYEENLIMPVYHLVSIGHTVSAKELYGYEVPYLQQVGSDADRMSPNFSETLVISRDRLRKTFAKWLDEKDDGSDSHDVVKVQTATESGFARKIAVYGCEMDADDFCRRLGLASTNVHIDQPGEDYRIITVGIGNSLGMSIYGASVLAANGETCDEIIKYYYTGVTISK